MTPMMRVIFGTATFATAITIFAPSFAMPPFSYCLPDDEARDVLQEEERDSALPAQLDEVRALERRLREEDAVVRDDADRQPA